MLKITIEKQLFNPQFRVWRTPKFRKLRMEINSKPEELDVLDRKIMQLEIEHEAIKREKDETKLKSLKAELANLKEERNELNAKWKSEKETVENVQNIKQEIENYKIKK